MSVRISCNDKKKKRLSRKKQLRKSTSMDNKVIKDYLAQKDAAPWFRGTSMYHMLGANALMNALRDDAEQRTTHRLRSCLNLIGLDPMIASKHITCLMRLSRGNDLAFLWFLWEMHYKTPKPGPYSVNEQLILSAICHLDAISTLRELDKILPNGHPSFKDMAIANAKRKRIKDKMEEAARKKLTKPKYVLPYFEKITRPKTYGKPLTLVLPSFKVKFINYKMYADPSFVVPNEFNRWFGTYDFNAGRRIAYSLIRETIGNLFENFESASLKAQTINVLCDYHKTMKELELKLERELKVAARDKCLKKCLGGSEEKEKRAQHVKDLLDEAIERQLCQFRREANTIRKEMTLKTITSDCDIYDVVMGGEFNECCKAQPNDTDNLFIGHKPVENDTDKDEIPLVLNNNKNKEKIPLELNNNKDKEKIPLELNNKDEMAKATGDGLKNDKVLEDMQPKCQIKNGWGDAKNPPKKVLLNSETKSKSTASTSHLADFSEKYMRNYDYGKLADTPTPSEMFFQRPKENQPFKFDYRKIFIAKPKLDETRQMKMAFLEALDKDISTLTQLQDAELNLDQAASECATDTFDKAVKKYEVEHKEELENQAREKNRPLNQYPRNGHYDCRDSKLMDQMLFDALAYLRRFPRLVLPQLPHCHKLPMLREWIAQRFGREYTPKERANDYRLSCDIFRALEKINFDFVMPNVNQMGRNQTVNYNCRKYLDKKCKHITEEYYKLLDKAFMEHTRIFWFATRAYVCSNGPPRKIFFAYMPSRYRDIQHFRLWKSSEYRNYVGAWNARQRAKRREQFFG